MLEKVPVDFTTTMLDEIDEVARELKVSRKILIARSVRQGLKRHRDAVKARLKIRALPR
jgi:metal-responsive CopG/Arc/MetJ family transcriptional regulator